MSIENAYNIWANQYDTNENRTRDLDKKSTIETLSKSNNWIGFFTRNAE